MEKNLSFDDGDPLDDVAFVTDAIFLKMGLGKYFAPDIETPAQWYSHRQKFNSHESGETLLLLYMLYHAMLDWIQAQSDPTNRFNQRLADDIPDWIDGKCGVIPFEWVATALCPKIDLELVKDAMRRWLKNPVSPSRL